MLIYGGLTYLLIELILRESPFEKRKDIIYEKNSNKVKDVYQLHFHLS